MLLVAVLLLTKPVGLYIADVMQGRPIWALRLGAGSEACIYRLAGIDPALEMGWKHYAIALLVFNSLGALLVYLLQRLQAWLPLNPQHFANVSPDSAFNTAVSFITNTNWQGYSGESTMSYLTQMAGLAVQNFLSAATGIVVAIALIRGFARHSTRSHRQLLGGYDARDALCIAADLRLSSRSLFVSQGVVQNFSAYKDVTTIETLTYQQPKTDAAGQPAQRWRRQSGAGDADHPHADAAHGSDGLAGGHQGARHQRRRLRQRQLRTPVREPHAASRTFCRCSPSCSFRRR